MAVPGIQAKYMEGLRLAERERSQFIELMKKNGVADRRKCPRIVIEGGFSVLLTMEAPGGSTAYFKIYPWDLSRGGVGFFHRAFVYPGTRCTFTGLTHENKPFTVSGEVARCSHVSGNVHAVGTKLDAEIDPEEILGPLAVAQGLPHTAGSEPADEWWTRTSAELSAISKLVKDRAPADMLRKAVETLSKHVATDPTPAAPPAAAPAESAAAAATDAEHAPAAKAEHPEKGAHPTKPDHHAKDDHADKGAHAPAKAEHSPAKAEHPPAKDEPAPEKIAA